MVSNPVNNSESPHPLTMSVDECWSVLRSQMIEGVSASDHKRVNSNPHWNPRGEYRGADLEMHSCEKRMSQSGLGWSWAYYARQTKRLDMEITTLLEELKLSVEEPLSLWPVYRGLWYLPLIQHVKNFHPESAEISLSLGFIEYLSSADAKGILERYCQSSTELAQISEAHQKLIEQPNYPYSRTGKFVDDSVLDSYIERKKSLVPIQIISEQIMRRYIENLHECEHLEVSKCIICAEEFHPEGCRLLPINGFPPVVCPSCVGVFNGIAHYELLRTFAKPLTLDDERKITSLLGSALLNFFDEHKYIPAADIQLQNELSKLTLTLSDPCGFIYEFKRLATVAPGFAAKSHFRSNALYLDSVGLFEGRAPQGGYRSVASDGHVCLSVGERSICEFLTSVAVPHEKEPRYPPHSSFNPNGLFRADFKVGEWLVEFAGRMAIDDYAARIQQKRDLAKFAGLNLLVLEPKDLPNLESRLSKILAPLDGESKIDK